LFYKEIKEIKQINEKQKNHPPTKYTKENGEKKRKK
jgi:hypothetical protein